MKLIVLSIISSFLLLSCQEETKKGGMSDSVSSIEIFNLKGEKVTLEKYKNKVTLLVFWATWCAPCIQEIPGLIALTQKYQGSNFHIVSINVDDEIGYEELTILERFSKDYGINYPVLWADQNSRLRFGGIQVLPTAFIINEKGQILEKLEGVYPEYILDRKIQRYLKKLEKVTT